MMFKGWKNRETWAIAQVTASNTFGPQFEGMTAEEISFVFYIWFDQLVMEPMKLTRYQRALLLDIGQDINDVDWQAIADSLK